MLRKIVDFFLQECADGVLAGLLAWAAELGKSSIISTITARFCDYVILIQVFGENEAVKVS